MKRADLGTKFVCLLMLVFTIGFLAGCATPSDVQGTDGEPWAGKLTGMIDADLTMYFSRLEEAQDIYLVKGTFSGDIDDVSGGYGGGTMRGDITGKVRDGIFNVRIRGHAHVRAGSAAIEGKLLGTLSKTQAFGTWKIDARDSENTYRFSGEWNAGKIGPDDQAN